MVAPFVFATKRHHKSYNVLSKLASGKKTCQKNLTHRVS